MTIKLENFATYFSINGVPQQRGSIRVIEHGDNIGMAILGTDRQLVAPVHFSDWVDGSDTPYPTKQTLLDDIAAFSNKSGGIEEAPNDGNQYARKNLAWDIVAGADVPGFPVGRWDYEAGTGVPPADNSFRFDNADPTLATNFYIDDNNSNGVDLGFIFEQIGDLGVFYVQVAGDADKYWYIEVQQGTDSSGYWTFPIITVLQVGVHATGVEYGILLVTAGQGVGNVPEAPNDGEAYRRESETWVADPLQDDAPANGFRYGREDNAWSVDPIQNDAPADGSYYGRKNNDWEKVNFDLFGESSILGAPFSTTEDTYQNVFTHTFTPPEAGDDWELSCTIAWTTTDKQKLAYFRFLFNGTPTDEIAVIGGEDDTVNVEYIISEELALTAALQTVILQTRNAAGESETITVERSRFVNKRFRDN